MTIRRWLRSAVVALALAAMTVLVLFGVSKASGGDADLSYNTVDYDVSIAKNGDMTIVQHLDMRLNDRGDDDGERPWKQLYQQYTLDAKRLTAITDVSVRNASTGVRYGQIAPVLPASAGTTQWNREYANHWYIADVTGGGDDPRPYDADDSAREGSSAKRTIEIGWNIPATTEQDHLRFDVAMTFKGTATAYDDVASMMWEPVGELNQVPIGELRGTVRFPDGVTAANSWAWLHFTGRSTTSRTPDGMLHFTASDIRNGQYLDLVMMFDVKQSSGIVRRANGAAKQRIIREENEQERTWRAGQQTKARRLLTMSFIAACLGLLMIVVGLVSSVRSNRNAQYHGDIEYWRDPPDMSPASAAALLAVMEPSPAKELSARQMASTVLSLVSKKAIAIYPGDVEHYQGIDMVHASPAVVSGAMRRKDSSRRTRTSTSTIVVLPIVHEHREALRLSDSEDGALHLLEAAATRIGSPVFDLRQMKRSFSGWQEGYRLRQRYQSAVDNEFALLGATGATGTFARIFGWCAVCVGVMAAVVLMTSGQLALACLICGTLMFGAMLVIFSARGVSLSERGQQLAGQVTGLKRYMEQFSDFKDRTVNDLVLWDRYLVYAVAFGISGALLHQMARAYPQLSDPQWLDEHAMGSMAYWLYRPMLWGPQSDIAPVSASYAAGTLGADLGDIGAQLSSSFADLNATIQMAAPSSPTGSSGGFSGGGFGGMSGGSGGGSFGGR